MKDGCHHKGDFLKSQFRNFIFQKCNLWRSCRVPQDVSLPPDRMDVVLAASQLSQFAPQLADEHINDLGFRFVNAAIKVVDEMRLGQG